MVRYTLDKKVTSTIRIRGQAMPYSNLPFQVQGTLACCLAHNIDWVCEVGSHLVISSISQEL